VDNDSPSGRGVSRGAVEVSCGAGGALRVRPAAESEWLTCGAGSRVSACGKYADLCRQRTASVNDYTATTTRRRRTTTTTTTTANGQPKAVMAILNPIIGINDGDTTGLFEEVGMFSSAGSGTVQRRSDETGNEQLNSNVIPQTDNSLRPVGSSSGAEGLLSGNTGANGSSVGDVRAPELASKVAGAGTPNSVETHPESHSVVTSTLTTSSPGDLGPKPSKPQDVSPTPPASSNVNDDATSQQRSLPTASTVPSDGNSGNHSTAEASATTTNSNTTQVPTVTRTQIHNAGSNAPTEDNQGAAINATDNSTPAHSNATQHSPSPVDVTAVPESQETNTTTLPSTDNTTTTTTTEAPTTTLSPVPVTDSQISSVASNMQKKANADSSVSSVWMRTAAPLLIVAVLFSVTVY
ncbi:uncharacterized protein TM35_000451580, partial [Trypanosoma theileri]